MKDEKKLHWLIRSILFMLVLCLLLTLIAPPFIYPYSDDAYGWTRAVYEEPRNSLDAVFIGTSNTVVFWVPLFAWRKYGIATCSLANNGGKIEVFRYLIEEARKTQPNAIYVISFGNPDVSMTTRWVHWATDYMKPSLTKLKLMHAYFKYNDFSFSEKAELMLPLFCYHSRWDELTESDFSRKVFAKGASLYTPFLENAFNITESVRQVEARLVPDQETTEALLDLLNYLEDNNVRAVFLNPPQFGFTDEELAETNSLLDMIEEHGFRVLRTREMLPEFNFDYAQDYYNTAHTNIHGASKYTERIARFLVETYAIQDKRDNPEYAAFNSAFKEYLNVISSYVFDFEANGLPRDYSLTAPKLLDAEEGSGETTIFWSESPEADGYLVYRRYTLADGTRGAWECIADVSSEQLQYTDVDPELWSYNFYTVVPYSNRLNTERQYGNFDCYGISALAQIS